VDVNLSPRILVLTGLRGSGKTMACLELIERARRSGLDCAGLVSPATLSGGVRTGADVVDVRTGERHAFTVEGEVRMFDHGVLAWAANRLDGACPCDLLVVDEIGPLELIQGRGWRNALDVIGTCGYGFAVIVVRPSLLGALMRELAERLPGRSGPPIVVTPQELGDIDPGSYESGRCATGNPAPDRTG
jgi:nucleoside-triphosphatase THEP1